jgi:hypothetical protein
MNLNESTHDVEKIKVVLDMEKNIQILEEDCLQKYGSMHNENEAKLVQPQFVGYSTNLIARMKIYKLNCGKRDDEMIRKREYERKELQEYTFEPSDTSYMSDIKKKYKLGKWNGKFFFWKRSIKELGDRFRKHLECKIKCQEEKDTV